MKRLGKGLAMVVHGLFLLNVVTLVLLSGQTTAKVLRRPSEKTLFVGDSLLVKLLLLALCLGAAAGIGLAVKRAKAKWPGAGRYLTCRTLERACVVVVMCFALLLVLSTQFKPLADSSSIMNAAADLRWGNKGNFQNGGYVSRCQNQAGIVVLLYFLAGVVGNHNHVAVQLLNVLALGGIYLAIFHIEDELEISERARAVTVALLFGFIPLTLYVNFVYGNIGALCFALMAARREIRVLKAERPRKRDIALAAGYIALAILLKQNYLIFFIGMALTAALKALMEKRARALILAAVLVVSSLAAVKLPLAFIECRIGEPLGEGYHSMAFVAMGLQETPERCAGWWNAYTEISLSENDYDAQRQKAAALESVRERLAVFREDRGYAADFFSRKTASQWADPSFQSWWVQTEYTDQEPSRGFSLFLSWGTEEALSGYLDLLQFCVYLGAALYILPLLRGKVGKWFLFELIFLGGYVFHVVWEAKGQYTLPYFVMLIPLAVEGYLTVWEELAEVGRAAKAKGPWKAEAARHKPVLIGLACLLLAGAVSLSWTPARSFFQRSEDTAAYSKIMALQKNSPNMGLKPFRLRWGEDYLALAENGEDLTLDGQGTALRAENIGAYSYIRLAEGNKGLDVVSGTDQIGQKVWTYQPNRSKAQRWRFVPAEGEDAFYLAYGTEHVLCVDPGTGATVLEEFSGDGDQSWVVEVLE